MRITGVATRDYKYEQCQMPIDIDEDLRFVVQFDEIDSLTNSNCKNSKCSKSSKLYIEYPNSTENSKNNNNGTPSSPPICNHEHSENSVKAPNGHHRTKNKSFTNSENPDYTRKQFREDVKQYFRREDLLYVAKVNKTDLSSLTKRVVPCIGCRKGIEAMFDKLSKKTCKNQIEVIKPKNNENNNPNIFTDVTYNRSHEFILTKSLRENDIEKFYDYLFMYGPRYIKIVEAMKTKKTNNRCLLHSLDSRGTLEKTKNNRSKKQNDDYMDNDNNYRSSSYLNDGVMVNGSLGYFGMGMVASRDDLQKVKEIWWSMWKTLPVHCKKELCCLDAKKLLEVIERYLEKHSFCHDCKGQIRRAYFKLCPKDFKVGEGEHQDPPEDEHLYQSGSETDSDGEEEEEDEAIDYTSERKSSMSSLEKDEEILQSSDDEKTKLKKEFLSKIESKFKHASVKKPRRRQKRKNVRKMMAEKRRSGKSGCEGCIEDDYSDSEDDDDDDLTSSEDFSNTDLTSEQIEEIKKDLNYKECKNGEEDEESEEVQEIESDDSEEYINQFNPLIFRGLRFCVTEGSKKHIHVTTVCIRKFRKPILLRYKHYFSIHHHKY